ncbi:MAG: sodium:proton antiporter [Bacteroidetes bacterium 4572_112]|nr:MAG: sodium:proton antiporter [Bacteroidetes bacterium 4572_112]
MLRNFLIALVLASFGFIFLNLYNSYEPKTELTGIAAHYAENGASEVGAANLVTAVVVSYRSFDTLGEITILFLTAAIISFFLKLSNEDENKVIIHKGTSEILKTASQLLIPLIFLFGVYVFINGHLTPGGGFQGGAIIASGVVLAIMANPNMTINHTVIVWVESLSGVTVVIIGVLGIILGGGFLDSTLDGYGLGEFGTVFSAGTIPVIYSLVGLKVGAEISNILNKYQKSQKES